MPAATAGTHPSRLQPGTTCTGVLSLVGPAGGRQLPQGGGHYTGRLLGKFSGFLTMNKHATNASSFFQAYVTARTQQTRLQCAQPRDLRTKCFYAPAPLPSLGRWGSRGLEWLLTNQSLHLVGSAFLLKSRMKSSTDKASTRSRDDRHSNSASR